MITFGYTIKWRSKDGGYHELSVEGATSPEVARAEAERIARSCGYPGHDGAWWRYLLAAIRAKAKEGG